MITPIEVIWAIFTLPGPILSLLALYIYLHDEIVRRRHDENGLTKLVSADLVLGESVRFIMHLMMAAIAFAVIFDPGIQVSMLSTPIILLILVAVLFDTQTISRLVFRIRVSNYIKGQSQKVMEDDPTSSRR